MIDTTKYLQETLELFALIDSYADGELNLKEATNKIHSLTGIPHLDMEKILLGVKRENIIFFCPSLQLSLAIAYISY